jgi:nucleotide-binding universal stress UspA family protein
MMMPEHDVVVALSNPANVARLVRLGCLIANEFEGTVVGATVVTVNQKLAPDDASPDRMGKANDLLAAAEAIADEMGARFEGRLAMSRGIAEVLDEVAEAHSAKAIVVGYSERQHPSGDQDFERVIDDVAAHAPCNLVVARFNDDGASYRKVLVPVAMRLNMDVRRDLLTTLRNQAGAQVDLVHFARDADEAEESREDLDEWLVERGVDDWVAARVDIHEDPKQAIVDTCRDYDAVVLGTPPLQTLRRRLFGSIPEFVAENADCTTLLVRQHEGLRDY